jgi:glycosyltransferase involved in cell wall biosynthesis
MRVAFNASFLGQASTGSGQYTYQLLRALARLNREDEYLSYSPHALSTDDSGLPPVRALNAPFAQRSENLAKLWFEQVSFPRACRGAGADLAHVPYWGPPLVPTVPTVVTVHDLIPLLLPAYRGSLSVRLYTILVSVAARRATAIITDSLHSRADIVHHLHVPAERVYAISLAADPGCQPMTDRNALASVRQKYGLPPTYILYLGGFDQRKNVPGLLAAYALVRQELGNQAPPLVVAGRLPSADTPFFPSPQRIAHELGIADRVLLPGWIAEEDKPALYSGAVFFAFLSLYEGFGLMPLEAMACGTPVLASRTSSLPEIVGDGGLLVDPTDTTEVAKAMTLLLRDSVLRQGLSEKALLRAGQFDWTRTAIQTLEVYHRATGEKRAGRFD